MSDRSLVMVIGPGRSGTSSMAGALVSCGFHVPGAIRGNRTNPTGFFEPRWVVNLHKRLLKDAGVRTLDADPLARERLSAINADESLREQVRGWLDNEFADSGQLVLKDPRMMWFRELWSAAAGDLGITPGFVVMVRHPAEVSASRSTYYTSRDVAAVAGWVNVSLLTEASTSGLPRRFVHYPDLLVDWRTELAQVARRLDIRLDPAPDQRPHPADELIDPSLRRMTQGWEDIAVPHVLADLGQQTFEAFHSASRPGAIADGRPFEALRVSYADLYDFGLVMTSSRTRRHEELIRGRALRHARRELEREHSTATPSTGVARLREIGRRLKGGR